MREILIYASEDLGGTQFSIYYYERNAMVDMSAQLALDIVLGCTPRILQQWTRNILQVRQDFGTAPKIEERGQVLRGQALQVPGCRSHESN